MTSSSSQSQSFALLLGAIALVLYMQSTQNSVSSSTANVFGNPGGALTALGQQVCMGGCAHVYYDSTRVDLTTATRTHIYKQTDQCRSDPPLIPLISPAIPHNLITAQLQPTNSRRMTKIVPTQGASPIYYPASPPPVSGRGQPRVGQADSPTPGIRGGFGTDE